ncbi:hypothetical protein [Streptococcus mitis]|uniref:Uncharacterized protein n=1 Tax=Streptococcus mitis TaxID=28037 RepID=A0A1X1JV13_STRMT|nr:hypothetical protein [Streptococcus mitis]ORO90831.1 hypothetical protein B7702_01615 [Streptococcus mitis]
MKKSTVLSKMESLKGAIYNLSGKIDEIRNNNYLSIDGKTYELEELKYKWENWYGAYYNELKTIADNLLSSVEGNRAEDEVKKLTDPGYQAVLQNNLKLFESGALEVSTAKALIDHYKDDWTALSLIRSTVGDIWGDGNPKNAEIAQYIPIDNRERTKDLLAKFSRGVDEINYQRLMDDDKFVKARVDALIVFLNSDFLDENMEAQ